jgi:thiamine biosynthesis protein ThiS
MSETIEVLVNGETVAVAEGATVTDLVAKLDLPGERVAVERNRRVVRKGDWSATRLEPGDRFEIVHFVGGG